MPTIELVVGCAVGSLVAAGLPGFTIRRRPATSVVTGELGEDDDLSVIVATLTRLGVDVADARLVESARGSRTEPIPVRPTGTGGAQTNPS